MWWKQTTTTMREREKKKIVDKKIASHYPTCRHSLVYIKKNKLLRNIAQHKFLSSFTQMRCEACHRTSSFCISTTMTICIHVHGTNLFLLLNFFLLSRYFCDIQHLFAYIYIRSEWCLLCVHSYEEENLKLWQQIFNFI